MRRIPLFSGILLLIIMSACSRAASPRSPSVPEGDADASALDANLEGLVCRRVPDADALALPCEALRSPGRGHRPIQPDEIPTLERMLDELPKASTDYERVLARLTTNYLELACLALHECIRDSLNPPKHDPQAARKTAEIQSMAEEKFHFRCAELRTRSVPARALCPN